MSKDIRRHRRVSFPSSVRLSWQDAQGNFKFGQAKCLDLSESGVRLELPEPIAPRSYVTLKAEKIGLTCTASVRHCTRFAGKYIIGLEFSSPLRLNSPQLAQWFRQQPDSETETANQEAS